MIVFRFLFIVGFSGTQGKSKQLMTYEIDEKYRICFGTGCAY